MWYRRKHHKSALEWDPDIDKVVREHAKYMTKGLKYFTQDGFEARARKLGQGPAGENIAYASYSIQDVDRMVQGWIDSPGHRKNILGDWTHCAIGVAISHFGESYLSQIFLKKRPDCGNKCRH